ncbi:MAG: C40 family peptidase [Gaiellales bacterium]
MLRGSMRPRLAVKLAVPVAALAAWVANAPSGAADAPSPPSATAFGVEVIMPGSATVASGITGGFSYPSDGSIVSVGMAAQQASVLDTQASASASASSGSLMAGAIEFSGAASSVSAAQAAQVSPVVSLQLSSLTVSGQAVTPAAGQAIAVGTWGTLDVESSQPASEPGLTGETASVLVLHVNTAQGGLPAGSEIVIATSTAAAAEVAPATPPPRPPHHGGGGSVLHIGGGGGPVYIVGGGNGAAGGRSGISLASSGSPPEFLGPKAAARWLRKHPDTRPPFHRRLVADPRSNAKGVRGRIVAAAESQIGWPYVWGGESEAEGGFDCSGLVDYAFAMAGHALPGRPTAQVLWAMSQPIRRSQLEAGDLVFLVTSRGYAYHVGLYAGNGRVVVAPHTGTTVQLQTLDDTPWQAFGRLWQPNRRAVPARYLRAPVLPTPLFKSRAAEFSAPPSAPLPPAAHLLPTSLVAAVLGRHVLRHPSRPPHASAVVSATPARDQDLGITPIRLVTADA